MSSKTVSKNKKEEISVKGNDTMEENDEDDDFNVINEKNENLSSNNDSTPLLNGTCDNTSQENENNFKQNDDQENENDENDENKPKKKKKKGAISRELKAIMRSEGPRGKILHAMYKKNRPGNVGTVETFTSHKIPKGVVQQILEDFAKSGELKMKDNKGMYVG